jgi:DNA-binding transcriptional LysR family regulator
VDLCALRTFVTIAETGSFSAAAARLQYAQSTLSHQIACLEKSLGAKLFERTPAGASPTSAGQTLLPFATAVLTLADTARDALARVPQQAVPVERLQPRVAAAAASNPGKRFATARVIEVVDAV